MKNQAFFRSMSVLSQPISFGALLLLLLNDFLFKKLWPSWLTGKLSDFAWLFLAPLVLAALIAWLPPFSKGNREKLAGLISFGITGCGYALVKTIPAVRDGLLMFWQRFAGFSIAVVVDPTDLIALLALVISGVLWLRQKPVLASTPSRGWLALPLLALLTVADAAAPDYGISCLALQNGSLQATSTYATYVSSDGGISWQDSEISGRYDCPTSARVGEPILLNGQNLRLRFFMGSSIEMSTDGGQTWQVDFNIQGSNQAQVAYYQKVHTGNAVIVPGPVDAVVDPTTGNAIFAMGHEGVLVRLADGTWQWVTVGVYHHVEFSRQIQPLVVLLGGEILSAVFLSFGLINTWIVRRRRWKLRILHVILVWLVWGISVLVFPPALTNSYPALISSALLLLIAIAVIPFGIENLVFLARRSPKRLIQVLLYALGGGVLFLLPYILWGLNAIPSYTLAAGFALIMNIAVCLLGYFSIHRSHPDFINP
jgi:hypothetical protein